MDAYCTYCGTVSNRYEGGCTELCKERLRAWDNWVARTQSPDHGMFHGDVNKPYKPTKTLALPSMSDKHAAQLSAYGRKLTAQVEQLELVG